MLLRNCMALDWRTRVSVLSKCIQVSDIGLASGCYDFVWVLVGKGCDTSGNKL